MSAQTRLGRSRYALSLSEHIGFGAGSLATATFTVIPGLVLLYYLTDVLGAGAAIAGIALFIPRLLDLVYNPLVGRLSDATVSRWGPRRPWMALGTIILPIGFVLMFSSPFDGDAGALWVALLLALTGLGFSFFVIPYSVLPAELGANTTERTSMISWRMAFLGLAILTAGGLAPMVAEADGGGQQGYFFMALIGAGTILIGCLAALYSAKKSKTSAIVATRQPGTIREALRAAVSNKAFRILIIVFMLLEIVVSVNLASLPYLASVTLGDEGAIAPLFICVVGPMVLTMPLWRRAALRIGKKRALIVAAITNAIGVVGLLVLPAIDMDIRMPVAAGVLLIAGVGFAGAQMLPQTMLADVLAVDATTSGHRRAGLLSGLWSAGETIAGSFGVAVYGVVLGLAGFISSTAEETVVQPMSAQWGIVVGLVGVAGLSAFIAAAVITRYPLTEAEADAVVEQETPEPETLTR